MLLICCITKWKPVYLNYLQRELHYCALVNTYMQCEYVNTHVQCVLLTKQDHPLAQSQGKSLAQPILNSEIVLTCNIQPVLFQKIIVFYNLYSENNSM